jgi:hypothetical protein
MARYVDCKKGLHRYSPAGEVGGGITRRTCSACGVVQIVLNGGAGVADTDLFTEPKLVTMFKLEALLARAVDESLAAGQSFGEAPPGRRRSVRAFG